MSQNTTHPLPMRAGDWVIATIEIHRAKRAGDRAYRAAERVMKAMPDVAVSVGLPDPGEVFKTEGNRLYLTDWNQTRMAPG
jgi:hypothetical protein